MNRRDLMLALGASSLALAKHAAAQDNPFAGLAQGRLKQSVMPQVWGNLNLTIQERCRILAQMGFVAMDLPQPGEVPVLRDHGLTPAMMTGTGTTFENGLIRRELHSQIYDATLAGIDMCADLGCPNLIALPGERRGMSREEGADNAVEILSRVVGHAEQRGVTLCMENTNSKVASDGRTDQVFDRLEWGFDVCRRVGSPNVRIVYDFYHAQIMDGDVTRTFLDNLDLICHLHVAGVPTRAEIDDTQELYYRYIAQAVADSRYEGYIAHEHTPSPGRNPLVSLAVGYDILTV